MFLDDQLWSLQQFISEMDGEGKAFSSHLYTPTVIPQIIHINNMLHRIRVWPLGRLFKYTKPIFMLVTWSSWKLPTRPNADKKMLIISGHSDNHSVLAVPSWTVQMFLTYYTFSSESAQNTIFGMWEHVFTLNSIHSFNACSHSHFNKRNWPFYILTATEY